MAFNFVVVSDEVSSCNVELTIWIVLEIKNIIFRFRYNLFNIRSMLIHFMEHYFQW